MKNLLPLQLHHREKVRARGFSDDHINQLCTHNGEPPVLRSLSAEEIQRDWLDAFPLMKLEENRDTAGLLLRFNEGTISFKPDREVWNPREKNWSKYLYAKRPADKPKGFNIQPWIPSTRPQIITEGLFDGLACTALIGVPCAAATAPSHVKYAELPKTVHTYIGDADMVAHHSRSLLPVVIGQCKEKGLKIAHLPRNPQANYAYTDDKIPEACKWGMEEWSREWKRQGLDAKAELQKVIDNAKHPFEYLRSIVLEYDKINIRWPFHTTQLTVVARAISDASERKDQRQILIELLAEITRAPKTWIKEQVRMRDDARVQEKKDQQAELGEHADQDDTADSDPSVLGDDEPYLITPGRPIEVHISNMLLAGPTLYGSHQSSLFTYDNGSGFWSRMKQAQALQMVQGHIEKVYSLDAKDRQVFGFGSTHQINSSLQALVIKAADARLDKATHHIAFSDQAFNCRTAEPENHSPEHGVTYGINSPLRLTADCPELFLKAIVTCYGDQALPVIRAWIRAIVDPTIPYGKFLLIVGNSGTGKGMLLEFLDSLLPSECRSELPEPGEIANTDKIYQLVLGKRYIAFHDLPARLKPMQIFYKLVENVEVGARKLNASETVQVQPDCRFSAATTKLPTLADGNDGFVRRALVLCTLQRFGTTNVKLKRSIVGNTHDHQQLRAEVIGWALTMPRDEVIDALYGSTADDLTGDTLEELEANADAAAHFVEECLVPSECEVTSEMWVRIFDAYRAFCDQKGFDGKGSQYLFQGRIRQKLPHLHRVRRKESLRDARAAGRDRDSRLNLPSIDWGFKLRENVVIELPFDRGLKIDPRALGSDGLRILRKHQPRCPQDSASEEVDTLSPENVAGHQNAVTAIGDAVSHLRVLLLLNRKGIKKMYAQAKTCLL